MDGSDPGVILPVVETIRRAEQINDPHEFFNWFDDYMLGVILAVTSWRVLKQKSHAIAYLIAAWGMATGGMSLSLMSQLKTQDEPGIFSW